MTSNEIVYLKIIIIRIHNMYVGTGILSLLKNLWFVKWVHISFYSRQKLCYTVILFYWPLVWLLLLDDFLSILYFVSINVDFCFVAFSFCVHVYCFNFDCVFFWFINSFTVLGLMLFLLGHNKVPNATQPR